MRARRGASSSWALRTEISRRWFSIGSV